ncbi:MAG: sensor histidine kinase [Acidimicrobiales bacterium]
MSLRARLLAGMAFVAVVLLAVVVLTTRSTRTELIGQIDDRLLLLAGSDGDGRFPYPKSDGGTPTAPTAGEGGRYEVERLSDLYEGYFDADGRLTTVFRPNLPGADQIGPPVCSFGDAPEYGARLLTTSADGSDITYRTLITSPDELGRVRVIAVPIDDLQQTIDRLMLVQLVGSGAILVALGLVGWWVVHLGIRPVKEMTAAATRIADGDLTVRVPEGSHGTESGELAGALNRMLGTIDSALDERARSEQRLRRFVADASHELRTPLTTIRGYAELYRMGGIAGGADLEDAMRRTEEEAARMGRLVEDMLVLAKLDEERPLDLRPVDIVALARDIAADARAGAPHRSIAFETTIDAAMVNGDEDRLRQVLGNVVSNAIVHTDSDVPVVVRVTRESSDEPGAPGAVIVIHVVDRGSGMSAEVAARVTERFFRADPARSRHRGGSGLGLSIVDAAVAAHGGSVEIESADGEGTTVRLVLPAAGP